MPTPPCSGLLFGRTPHREVPHGKRCKMNTTKATGTPTYYQICKAGRRSQKPHSNHHPPPHSPPGRTIFLPWEYPRRSHQQSPSPTHPKALPPLEDEHTKRHPQTTLRQVHLQHPREDSRTDHHPLETYRLAQETRVPKQFPNYHDTHGPTGGTHMLAHHPKQMMHGLTP
jgi:hypothetical protein